MYKKYFIISIGISALSLLFIASINFIIDPFQQYRIPIFYKIPFYIPQRYHNPGLAKWCNYDTAIIGSSMTENFILADVNKLLGANAINLSISGGTAYEERVLLDTVIHTGKANKIIFGFDIYAYLGSENEVNHQFNSNLPIYLYDDDIINDYQYLITFDTLKYSYSVIKSNYKNKTPRTYDFNMAYYWGDKYFFSKNTVLAKFRQGENLIEDFHGEKWRYALLTRNFDVNLKPLIEKHPDIKWYIIFPPYSILAWINMQQKGVVSDALNFKKYVYESLLKMKNVEIYDFQSDREITLNLNNYKDLTHYSPEISKYILAEMSQKGHVITKDNYKNNLASLYRQIVDYTKD